MDAITSWLAPALDVAIVGLLALVVWKLGADPARGWRECEERLRTILAELQALVGDAERSAQELDRGLATRAARLEELLAEPAPAPRSVAGVEREVAALAAEGLSAEDVARRLDLGVAEVRLMLGVQAVREAAARVARGKKDAAEAAART